MKNIYLFALLGVMIIFSCQHQHESEFGVKSDSLLKKTIAFPSTLLELNGTKFQKIDSFLFDVEDKIKIISIVDGNCIKCIVYQLNQIDSVFNNVLLPDNSSVLIFILNVQNKDSAYFMRFIRPAIKAKGVILWDTNYYFERENKLFTSNINLRTFMIDDKNKVIQYGNPVLHPTIIENYQKKLLSKYFPE